MSTDIKGAKEERLYFLSVLETFKSYRELSLMRIRERESCLDSLPFHHRKMLTKYQEDLLQVKKCVEVNASLIPLVLKEADSIFGNAYNSVNHPSLLEQGVGVTAGGLDRVQAIFKQLMRDWSSLGAAEREQCYGPIIKEIFANYPEDKYTRSNINVLVPGAGLGRLAFEIASNGFSCQGNEFNMFMLIVSYFVLNNCKKLEEYEIYPWIQQYCNYLKVEDQLLSCRFPDVTPMPTPENEFSMIAGDFLEVYTKSDEWHCVATCFFIDCAPNVVQFIETIYNILKPGGLWVNLGPLLYHYSDMENEKSIEPSLQVVLKVINEIGFEIEKCETGVKTKYCQNPNSMLQSEYSSVFFVCRKPINVSDPSMDFDGSPNSSASR